MLLHSIFALPARFNNSMTNETDIISLSKFLVKVSNADIVPPVARRSSMIATLEPGLSESICI